MRPRRGATFIEVLIVVAILSILAALLFPVFAAAKDAAYEAQENSQFKSLALARGLYMNDHDDAEPGSSVPLVRGRYVPATQVRSTLDPFAVGWANKQRGPGSAERPTTYKDSFPTLFMVTDPIHFPAFVRSRNGGWLVAAGRNLKIIHDEPVIAPVPYKRLTFDGGVVRRRMPIVSTPDSDTLDWALLYSDDDVIRELYPNL